MIAQAALFLIDTLTGFLTFLLLLRFYMQAFRVSFSNQIGTFVLQLTNWLVIPLRRHIPGISKLDLATLLAAYVLQIILLLATFALRGGLVLMGLEGLIILVLWQAVLATLRFSLYLLIGALLLQSVLSWVNPFSPLAQPISQLTQPFLNPIRRFIPPVSGIDLAPLAAILLAQLILIFV